MPELRRRRIPEPPRPRTPRASAGAAPAAEGATGAGTVSVQWGPFSEDLALAGMTVGEVYRMLRGPYKLAPAVRANVNGREAAADTELDTDDRLEFVRLAGEKGAV